MKKKVPDIICGLPILLFAYAAISKFIDRQHFQAVLAQMLFIKYVSGFISFVLPITELVVCAFLFIPDTRLLGLYASLGLMIVFTLYIAYMIFFAAHLFCSCGGVLQSMSWRQHFFFNLFFTGLSVTGIKLYQSSKNIVATYRQPDQPPQGKS